MATSNRATLINKTIKVVQKHFQPVSPPTSRSLLEHLLYACCLENSLHEVADQVFETLQRDYFDLNEVRVSTIRELSEVMKPLNDPEESAKRLKRVLQSMFETHYLFDLESLKKQNIGQTAKQLSKYNGATPFVVSYVTQHALLGHSIPVNQGLLKAMRIVGVISDAEAAKGTVPGLERTVPKVKGIEIGALLHQLGVEMHRSPYGPRIRKILLEISPDCKNRLPKRPAKKKPVPPEKKPAAVTKQSATVEKTVKVEPKKKSAAAKQAKPTATKKAAKKKPAGKTTASKTAKQQKTTASGKKKVVTKKVVKKKVAKKASSATSSKTTRKKKVTNKRLSKRKPR